jgi:serine/threonine-protein kinase
MRRILVYSAIILAFFVVGLLVANFLLMPLLVGRGDEIAVPNVCNQHLDTAIEMLRSAGLDGVVVERRFDRIIDEGYVIIQDPLPDARVKRKRIINLTVSLGAETVSVPYLAGIGYEQGLSILNRIGLVVTRVDSVFSDSIGGGKIVGTEPGAETGLRKGDGVVLIVSKGLVLRMPNLIGQQVSQAQIVLERMGLVIGAIEEIRGTGTRGTVIIQNPEPGRIMNRGDTVNLMVIK